MKKIKIVLFLLVFIICGNSCKKEDIMEIYSFSVYEFNSNAPQVDLQRISNYLDTKNLRTQESFKAQKSKIDDIARHSFDEKVAQIIESELGAEVVGQTSFSYAVVKFADSQEVILKKKTYAFQQKF